LPRRQINQGGRERGGIGEIKVMGGIKKRGVSGGRGAGGKDAASKRRGVKGKGPRGSKIRRGVPGEEGGTGEGKGVAKKGSKSHVRGRTNIRHVLPKIERMERTMQ